MQQHSLTQVIQYNTIQYNTIHTLEMHVLHSGKDWPNSVHSVERYGISIHYVTEYTFHVMRHCLNLAFRRSTQYQNTTHVFNFHERVLHPMSKRRG